MSEPLRHNEELIDMGEDVEINHRNYLTEWDEKVWPIFKNRGISKEGALTYWMLNKAISELAAITRTLEEVRDELQENSH
jgi:hypothetical protein